MVKAGKFLHHLRESEVLNKEGMYCRKLVVHFLYGQPRLTEITLLIEIDSLK
jgi:hypothetical protein